MADVIRAMAEAHRGDIYLEGSKDINYQGIISAEFESFKYMDEVLGNGPARAAELTMQSIKGLT